MDKGFDFKNTGLSLRSPTEERLLPDGEERYSCLDLGGVFFPDFSFLIMNQAVPNHVADGSNTRYTPTGHKDRMVTTSRTFNLSLHSYIVQRGEFCSKKKKNIGITRKRNLISLRNCFNKHLILIRTQFCNLLLHLIINVFFSYSRARLLNSLLYHSMLFFISPLFLFFPLRVIFLI